MSHKCRFAETGHLCKVTNNMARDALSQLSNASREKCPPVSQRLRSVARALPARPDPQLLEMAQEIRATPIPFVDDARFHGRGAEKWLKSLEPEWLPASSESRGRTLGVAFMTELVQAPLLTPPQEQYLFLRMNFLKYQAAQWQQKLKPTAPNASLMERIRTALAAAMEIRNQICQANLRLVVAVARNLSNSLDQLSELTSEGLLPLMRAVELFNAGLGNRFSTYATWAVRNQMLRVIKRQRVQQEYSNREEEAPWANVAETRRSTSEDVQIQAARQAFTTSLVAELTERERMIVTARFGLDGEPGGQSLSEISVRQGLSKERVRQIVQQAVGKLRTIAEKMAPDLCDAWG